MSDEPRQIAPYLAIAPDLDTPVRDFRPRYEDPATTTEEADEPFGGLTVEEVTPEGEGSGEDAPKGDTARESANSSKTTGSSQKVPEPAPMAKSANADSGGSQSKQDKVSPPSS
jgi:hypothetical protein